MKLKSFILFVFTFFLMQANAMLLTEQPDSIQQHPDSSQVIDLDSILNKISSDSIPHDSIVSHPKITIKTDSSSVNNKSLDQHPLTLPKSIDLDSIRWNKSIDSSIIADKHLLPQKPKIQINPRTNNTRHKKQRTNYKFDKQAFDSLLLVQKQAMHEPVKLEARQTPPVKIDSALLFGNPFFIDLVYVSPPIDFNWNLPSEFRSLYYRERPKSLCASSYTAVAQQSPEDFIIDLRNRTRNNITMYSADLYLYNFEQLPDPDGNKNHQINKKKIDKLQLYEEQVAKRYQGRLRLKKLEANPWTKKGNVNLQFSQNYISSNWHQGGNSNLAILSIVSGQLNYDDKKNVQWDNSAEWRMGFNSISGDTLRSLSTNDDVFKVTSKLGLKAGGNWYYSTSVDFSTQLFNSYAGINSTVMKASLFTPVRVNIGVGLDYKYKKIFSLMLSPISYKYIYVKNTQKVDPNLFGVEKGKSSLSDIGSSFKAQLSCPITSNIQLDSKFTFYTNYEKVEIDWEAVCNLTINRFMSTRVSFNPRYDNTVIEKAGDHAKVQFKQLLSVGFSYKL